MQNSLVQHALALLLALLVGWSAYLAGGVWGLPAWLAGVLAGTATLTVLATHLRRSVRASGADPARPALPADRATWVLLGLLVVALLLRVYGLTQKPAWEDEMWTLRNMYTASYLELLRVAFDDYWPPLHYLVLNSLSRFTSTEIFWLRVPSVVFGVASVGLVYWAGVRFFRDRVVALLAAAFVTGATSHVLYSQEARVYAMLVLFAVPSAWLFLRSHRERRISPAYVGVTTLLVYSHSFASWYFVAAQSVYLLLAWAIWRDRRAFWKGFFSQALVLLLWIPLVAAFLYARLARAIVVPTGWATGAETIPWLPDLVELYQGLMVRSWPGAGLMAMLIGLAGLGLLIRLFRTEADAEEPAGDGRGARRRTESVLFLCCWATVPVLFSLLVTWFTSLNTFGEIRYHLTVLPGLALLAAGGVLHLRSRAAVGAVVSLAVLLPILELPRYYAEHDQPAVDEAARIVREHELGDETIYIGRQFRSFTYYYRGIFPRIGSEQWDSLTAAHRVDETREEWRRLTEEGDRDGLEALAAMPGRHKWGDTFAYERIPTRIRHVGFLSVEDDRAWVRAERARGGLQEPYWVVFRPRDREESIETALELEGVPCGGKETFEVRDVALWHCPGEGAGG